MNKRETIQRVGNITRMRNYEVQKVLEGIIQVWSDELAAGGRIEIEHFLVLQTVTTQHHRQERLLIAGNGRASRIPTDRTRIKASASKYLRQRIREQKSR